MAVAAELIPERFRRNKKDVPALFKILGAAGTVFTVGTIIYLAGIVDSGSASVITANENPAVITRIVVVTNTPEPKIEKLTFQPSLTPEPSKSTTTPTKLRATVTSRPPTPKKEVFPNPTSTPNRGDWYHLLDIMNDEVIPVKAGESVYGILPPSKDNSRSLMEVKSFLGNNPNGTKIRLWGEQKINELYARLSNKGYGNTKDGFPPDDGTIEYRNGKWTLYQGKAGFVMISNTINEPFSMSFTVTNRGKQCDAGNTRTFIGSIGRETSCWVDWWKNAEIVNP